MMARKIALDAPSEAELVAFVGSAGKRKKRSGLNDAAFATRLAEARAMMHTGNWKAALPVHFVAMYALLHEGVYGVAAAELGPSERVKACGAAKRMLEREFTDDDVAQPERMAAFMRWAWQREQGREKWRRDTGNHGRRIGWAFMFGGHVLTDWRLDCARVRGGPRK